MSKRIPQHKIDEIYNVVDIVEVVGEFLQMKKRGTNYFALSPWTSEKTPSFAVSPSKNIFKDFSTGKGGNAITFLMELEGMTYVEALKWVANKYGIDLEIEETEEDITDKDTRESLYILNEFAARWFNEQLIGTETGRKIGLSYFKERGILEGTIKEFQLGYSPDDWEALSQAAIKKQYKEEYLVETGLAFRSDKDNKLLDRFKGRLIFPIHNHLGKVIGFGGRIMGSHEKSAKYINSPESPIYHKGQVLYGLFYSKQHIRDQDEAILVEGYMDVISLLQAGVKNVVATSGTALTEDQIRLLKRFSKNVLLIYDADKAGINAALRGADLMLEQELNVRILLLPPGEDPDSYVKANGKSGFEEYAKAKGKDFVEFKIDHLLADGAANDPSRMAAVLHEIAETIARMPDRVRQGVYIPFAAQKLGIKEDVLNNALRQSLIQRAKQEKRSERFQEQREKRELNRNGTGLDQNSLVQLQGEELSLAGEKKTSGPLEKQETELLRLIFNYAGETIKIRVEEDENEKRAREERIKKARSGEKPEEEIVQYETYNLVEYMQQELEGLVFENEILEGIRVQIFAHFEEKGEVNINYFINHPDQEIARLSADLLTIPFEVSENWVKFDIKAPAIDANLSECVESAVLHFKFKKIKRLLAENQEKLRSCKDSGELDRLLRIFTHLNNLKQSLSKTLGIVIHE